VTHSDHRYVPKALALHDSLKRHHSSFTLWLVCTSPEAAARALALGDPTLRVIPLADVERAFPELLGAKGNRNAVEYYYTLTPAICRYVLEREGVEVVTYLDSDILFFSSPERVFDALGPASIGITPHKFSFFVRHAYRVGDYNVGWITFRNDERGRACLRWWFDRCIEWCYQRYEEGKYADQGYLNWFVELFPGVKVLEDPGFNLAPWNLANYRINDVGGNVTVDGRPLVFFHYADFVQISRWHYSTNTSSAFIWLTPKLRRVLFRPYIEALREVSPDGLPRGLRDIKPRNFLSLKGPKELVRMLRKIFFIQYMFVFRGRVI